MNAAPPMLRRFSSQFAIKTTFLALIALAPAAGFADDHPNPIVESRVGKVSLEGLDLSTVEGRRVAYERVHQTARQLCAQLDKLTRITHQAAFVKCVDEAMASALRQVGGPTFAANEKLRTAP